MGVVTTYPGKTELEISKERGQRSEAIDFLRGLAVILVLFSHHKLNSYLNNMGWIGVDLFFVISGFLVSSLLFAEYKLHGNIRPGLFLIRRGFKIYPLFYFSILITVIQQLYFPHLYVFPESQKLFLNNNGIFIATIVEVFFLQSYFFGFWGHHWSLSIEEFFYFSLTFIVFYLIKKGKLRDHKWIGKITFSFLFLAIFLRCISNILFPHSIINFTGFHLRYDSLFSGVYISYLYNFRRDKLEYFYRKFRIWLFMAVVPLIAYTAFVNVLNSLFLMTIGFTLIYLSFDILLLIFLFEREICDNLKKWFGKTLFKLFVNVGIYSYSIYLFHTYILRYVTGEDFNNGWGIYSFIIYFFGGIILGIGLSKLIEIPMLRLRDRLFPRRSVSFNSPNN